MINANRNLAAYEAFGAPVWPDSLPDYAGPLAGFLTGLERCETPGLLTVPCDTPLFPLDLAVRLADALTAKTPTLPWPPPRGGWRRRHPCAPSRCSACCAWTCWRAWCLHPEGGRKIDAWTAQHKTVTVPFDQPNDDPRAFFNANTLAELHSLETR
jgi:molybdopterin-guanine dinucleotide biosynthesis protein A